MNVTFCSAAFHCHSRKLDRHLSTAIPGGDNRLEYFCLLKQLGVSPFRPGKRESENLGPGVHDIALFQKKPNCVPVLLFIISKESKPFKRYYGESRS